MMTLLGVFVMAIGWLSLCLQIVKEDERGIKVFLGKPGKTIGSGLRFRFWPLQKIVIFPTKQQEVEIPARPVITKPGKYQETKYSAARIMISPVIYFFWPENLTEAVTKGPDPQSPKKIRDFFEETVADALRIVGGERTWRECVQERRKFSQDLKDILLYGGSPFDESGIKKVYVAIKEIDLPPKLEEAITAPEIARMLAEAKKKEGEGLREFLKLQGEGEAAARDAIFKAIEKGGIEKETLLTLREMAKGTSNTILFSLPPEIYETMKRSLGGKNPEELLKLLGEKDIKKLIRLLEEASKGGEK